MSYWRRLYSLVGWPSFKMSLSTCCLDFSRLNKFGFEAKSNKSLSRSSSSISIICTLMSYLSLLSSSKGSSARCSLAKSWLFKSATGFSISFLLSVVGIFSNLFSAWSVPVEELSQRRETKFSTVFLFTALRSKTGILTRRPEPPADVGL